MNLLYSLPFWPYLYTPWLFREMAWMLGRGHRIAVLSLGGPPGPAADLKAFGLQDVPVLEVRTQFSSDKKLLRNLITLPMSAWRARPPRSLSTMRQAAGLRQGLHEWATIKRVVAFVRRHKIDVVEAHWAAHSAMMARQILQATGIPFAVRMHGGDLHKNPSPDLPLIVESAAAVCPVSQFLADLLLGQRPVARLPVVPKVVCVPGKLRICPNGIPGEAIAKVAAPQNDQAQVVGTIGRLDPEKRHEYLVHALASLAPQFPGLRLLLIGGGQLEDSLRTLAAELGVADRMEITGALAWPQLIEACRKLHIYAHMSPVEGFGIATLEGISQGIPAVAPRTGAHARMIDEGVTGHLTDIDNPESVTDRLRQLLEAGATQRQAMGKRSLELIRDRFLFDKLMLRIESILDAVRTRTALPA